MTTSQALRDAIEEVMAARSAQELFGDREPGRRYRQLAGLLHPDRTGATGAAPATDAYIRLTTLWQSRNGTLIETPHGRYRIGTPAYQGDLADLYPAGDDQLVKIPRDPANNDLMRREARALRALVERGDPTFLPYVPRLVESFRHQDTDTGARRRINVLGTTPGLRSLAEVRRRYPDGVDPRDAAWMWRRLLVALGFTHRAGVVHGAILPEHVLIEPAEHGVVLVDWCYAAVDPPETIPALVPEYADWYPIEVRQRLPPGPGTDIAMATRCMTTLIGPRLPASLRRFAAGCTQSNPNHRPDDAWRLLAEFDEVLANLYGPRRFRPFTL